MNRHSDFSFPLFGAIGAAIFGFLMDFAPLPDEPLDEYAKRAWRRTVIASGYRWVSDAAVVLIVTLVVLGSKGVLAPLIVLPWLFITNRLVVRHGHTPSPAAAVAHSRLGFFMLAAAVFATLVSAVNLLIPWVGFPVVATVSAAVSGVTALADAWLTARAIREAQVPQAPDMTLFKMVVLIVGIRRSVYEAGLADGSFTVEETGDRIVSHIPLEAAGLLLDRDGMDARCRDFYPDFEIETVDAPRFLLTLMRVEEETKIRRDAMARSGDLFAEHLGTGLDDFEVIDLGLHDQPLPRLS